MAFSVKGATEGALVYIDGDLLPPADARISVFDSGFNFADGVFEGIRVYNGRVFKLEEHIKRLYRSARAFHLTIPMDERRFAAEVIRWLRAGKVSDNFHFRPIVTRGDRFPPRLDPRFCEGEVRVVMVGGPIAPAKLSGQRLCVSSVRRIAPDALDANIKSLNYGNNLLARLEAHRAGFDDSIMLDPQGMVAEASAANLFIVQDGRLVTPWPKACLDGITRRTVMDLAAAADIFVAERDLTATQVLNADEVFLTGTGSEIVPVIEVDGQKIGNGAAGQVTLDLARKFQTLVRSQGTTIAA